MKAWLIVLLVTIVILVILVPVLTVTTGGSDDSGSDDSGSDNSGSDDSGSDSDTGACFVTVSRPDKSNDAVQVRLDDGSYSKKYSKAMGSMCLKTYASDGMLMDKSNKDSAVPMTFSDGVITDMHSLWTNDSDNIVIDGQWSFEDGTGVNVM